ncbi:outer membrane protein [Ruegeria arenilitoris]|uniref:outer membrane protein n=1 Tax=Ruegeria arenilitoris TaxID=1173585 RepID=UPI00147B6951|nr:outer membrane beta-barrel protein [Ruegeria arenilitoris]
MQLLPFAAAAEEHSDQASFAQGPYVALDLAAANAKGNSEIPILSGGTERGSFDSGTGRGFNAAIGYNVVNGRYLYGAEFRYSNLVDVSERSSSGRENREALDLADVRGRFGIIQGDFLYYGAIGWSWSRFRVHPSRKFGPRESLTLLDGFNIGVGVEYNLSDRWFLGGEYSYRDLSGRFDEASNDTSIDLGLISARVGFRF